MKLSNDFLYINLKKEKTLVTYVALVVALVLLVAVVMVVADLDFLQYIHHPLIVDHLDQMLVQVYPGPTVCL